MPSNVAAPTLPLPLATETWYLSVGPLLPLSSLFAVQVVAGSIESVVVHVVAHCPTVCAVSADPSAAVPPSVTAPIWPVSLCTIVASTDVTIAPAGRLLAHWLYTASVTQTWFAPALVQVDELLLSSASVAVAPSPIAWAP